MSKDQVQFNILKGHGRNFSRLLFINFKKGELRNGMKNLLSEFPITSAKAQDIQIERFKETNDGSQLGIGLYLSRNCYDDPEMVEFETPNDHIFRAGLNKLDYLDNQEVSTLFDESQIMLLLACDNEALLDQKVNIIETTFPRISEVHIEKGKTYRRNKKPIEHFGFYDGLEKSEYQSCEDGSEILEGFGSYLAYLKYEQNVKRFNELSKHLAASINISLDMAVAQAMGVFQKSGDPLTLASRDYKRTLYYIKKSKNTDGSYASNGITQINYGYSAKTNKDYNFKNDSEGLKCPFHAHSRKMNPRDQKIKNHIVRRGVTYDYTPNGRSFNKTWGTFKDEPGKNVGIHFLSFQKDIGRNLLPMIDRANQRNGSGIDPIIGKNSPTNSYQQWNKEWNKQVPKKERSIQGVTSLIGGGFFHAPSMEVVNQLKNFNINVPV